MPDLNQPTDPLGASTTTAPDPVERPHPAHGGKGRRAAARDAVGAVFGAILGLAPHVMHHVGLIAGAAFITGAGGNTLFFLVGLVLSIPLLRRLYRRFQTWRAPAIAVAVFAAVFSFSAFVVGPAISGGDPGTGDLPPPPAPSSSLDEHGH